MAQQKRCHKRKSVVVNMNILAHLIYLSISTGRMTNFEKALNDLLSTVPLSLCNAEESLYKTCKNKLAKILMSKSNEENSIVKAIPERYCT